MVAKPAHKRRIAEAAVTTQHSPAVYSVSSTDSDSLLVVTTQQPQPIQMAKVSLPPFRGFTMAKQSDKDLFFNWIRLGSIQAT